MPMRSTRHRFSACQHWFWDFVYIVTPKEKCQTFSSQNACTCQLFCFKNAIHSPSGFDSFTLTYNNEIKIYPLYRLLEVSLDNYAKYDLYLVHVVQGLKLLFFLNGLLSYYQGDMWSAVCEIAHMATLNREEPNFAQVCNELSGVRICNIQDHAKYILLLLSNQRK